MSSYVERNLSGDEKVICEARLSKVPLILSLIWSVIVLLAVSSITSGGKGVFFGAAIIFALWLILKDLITILTTELALTDQRIIAKHGLIKRNTMELRLSKLESVQVDQGIIARIFNYGSVVMSGTGGSKSPFKAIADPFTFKNAVDKSASDLSPS